MNWSAILGGFIGALIYQGIKAIIVRRINRRRAAAAEAERIAKEKFWR